MKQLYVMAFLCLFGIQFASAQVKKGNVLVGGTLGVKNEKEKQGDLKNEATTYSFTPKVGYAITDKWMAGVFASGGILNSERDIDAGLESITSGVFVRNYHMLGKKLALYGEANVGYSSGSAESNGMKISDSRGITINVLPGLSYFVSKRFVLEGEFGGLSYYNGKFDNKLNNRESTTHSFNLSFAQEFELGVSFLF